jgi:predicted phage tail protein
MRRLMRPICIVPMVLANAVGVVQAQADGAEAIPGTMIGQIIIFLTTVAGFLFNIYRENRNRRWDLEDRARAREETMHRTNVAAVEVKKELDKQSRVVGQVHRELKQAIEDNTALTAAIVDKTINAEERLAEICAKFERGDRNGGEHSDETATQREAGPPYEPPYRPR